MTDALRDGGLADAALAVWTTTPWTMPANLAVAVNDRMEYSLVQVCSPFGQYDSVLGHTSRAGAT